MCNMDMNEMEATVLTGKTLEAEAVNSKVITESTVLGPKKNKEAEPVTNSILTMGTEQQHALPKKKPLPLFIGIVLCVVFVYIGYFFIMPNMRYNKAVKQMKAGDYATAAISFEKMKQYRDAPLMRIRCISLQMVKLMVSGDLVDASTIYKTYASSSDEFLKSLDESIIQQLSAWQNETQFDQIANWIMMNTPTHLERYKTVTLVAADALLTNGAFDYAEALYSLYPQDKKATENLLECNYQMALKAQDASLLYTLAQVNYKNSRKEFTELYPNKMAYTNVICKFVKMKKKPNDKNETAVEEGGDFVMDYELIFTVQNNGLYPLIGSIEVTVKDFVGWPWKEYLKLIDPLMPGQTLQSTILYELPDSVFDDKPPISFKNKNITVYFSDK